MGSEEKKREVLHWRERDSSDLLEQPVPAAESQLKAKPTPPSTWVESSLASGCLMQVTGNLEGNKYEQY